VLLEAGRRLGFEPPELAFQLSSSEIGSALRGARAGAEEVAHARAAAQVIAAAATPPPMLGAGGFGGGPPPGLELPGALGRMVTAVGMYMEAMAGSSGAMGIGTGVVRGRAVVAIDPEDAIDRIQPGDILVTGTTTPAFGAVMPLLGGVVAASGGALSHTAIVARELGIPAVVGVTDALVRIADGAMIEVDAAAAEVRVV
jgi:pyruvate,water dikinase